MLNFVTQTNWRMQVTSTVWFYFQALCAHNLIAAIMDVCDVNTSTSNVFVVRALWRTSVGDICSCYQRKHGSRSHSELHLSDRFRHVRQLVVSRNHLSLQQNLEQRPFQRLLPTSVFRPPFNECRFVPKLLLSDYNCCYDSSLFFNLYLLSLPVA